MQHLFQRYTDRLVELDLPGRKKVTGMIANYGLDIVVIYDGSSYFYISLAHIGYIKQLPDSDAIIELPLTDAAVSERDISFRKILSQAKGQFVELYVTGSSTIHGYITNVLTNYIVFYSPIYRTLFIPLHHLKWLSFYLERRTPYSLDLKFLPVQPTDLTLARTFEEQIKKLEGKIVILDLGKGSRQGLLSRGEGQLIELITAEEQVLVSHMQHIKSVHSPYI